MENICGSIVNDGVAGVISALAPNHHIRFRGEDIDDFAFPFVAPLRPDQNRISHLNLNSAKIFPTHLTRRSRGCRQTIWSHEGLARCFGEWYRLPADVLKDH